MEAKPRTRRDDRAENILDAAENVLREAGGRGLTIDAVAVSAGMSKGGVLHHYGSKDALICALVSRKIKRMREGIEAHLAKQEPGRTAVPLAMVANARQTYCDEHGFPRALLLASAENPEALAGFRVFLADRLATISELEGKPGAGAVFLFAIIGLMIGRTLGFHDLGGEEADRIFDALDASAQDLPDP